MSSHKWKLCLAGPEVKVEEVWNLGSKWKLCEPIKVAPEGARSLGQRGDQVDLLAGLAVAGGLGLLEVVELHILEVAVVEALLPREVDILPKSHGLHGEVDTRPTEEVALLHVEELQRLIAAVLAFVIAYHTFPFFKRPQQYTTKLFVMQGPSESFNVVATVVPMLIISASGMSIISGSYVMVYDK